MSTSSGAAGASGAPAVIVVGYDGSEPSRVAVERAIDRARGGARIIVVHAWQTPLVLRGSEFYVVVATACQGAAEDLLERLPAEQTRLGSVDWEPRLIEGPAGKVIADVAAEEGADEVIVGTRGAGRLHSVLGGTAQRLLHHAECPVTFIPQRLVEARGRGGSAGEATVHSAGPGR